MAPAAGRAPLDYPSARIGRPRVGDEVERLVVRFARGERELGLQRIGEVAGRPEVAARLRQALEFAGDLGDDPDYLDAIRERDELEERPITSAETIS